MNNILYPILELKEFIICSVAALVLLTVVVFIAMGRRKNKLDHFGWQMLFLGLSSRELLYLAFSISQICLIVSLPIADSSLGTVQVVALGALCLLKGLCGLSLTGFFGEIFYTLLMGAALTIGNLLRDYMRETGIELYIGTIWILLILFIVQYSIYYFFRGLERMLHRHETKEYRLDGSGKGERRERRRGAEQE